MRSFRGKRACCLKGEIRLPGDKSIAHRCIIAASLCPAKTTVENFPANEDCLHTLSALQKLGIMVKSSFFRGRASVTVVGRGLKGLDKPRGPVFVGDSGTTIRLLLGVLAGQNFAVKLTAGKFLSQRPMLRVTRPLRMMGAKISARRNVRGAKSEEYSPITIKGGNLKPIAYKMPLASAQVKSAILLAGLFANGATRVIEPLNSRDHTERILKLFKADIKVKENTIVIKGNKELVSPGKIYVPADISSASFLIVAALLCPGSKIKIKNVSLNPTRTGALKVLRRMGAAIKFTGAYELRATSYEPMGDIVVKSSKLRGTVVKKNEIPSLIDELPILMVAACNATGKTVFKGVGELRVKETDRIRSMSENLKQMGADISVERSGASEVIVIKGRELKGAQVRSFGDHRTVMSMIVAGLSAQGTTKIDDISCINKSFPGFTSLLKTLTQ